MSDRRKSFPTPISKTPKSKPQTPVPATTSKIRRIPTTSIKEKNVPVRPRNNNNITVIGEGDRKINKADISGTGFESVCRQIAYGRFLRTMLTDCLVEENIEREETQIDNQMAQLADRFKNTMDQLDKTNRRLKEISYITEQKRLLDLKSQDYTKFQEISKNSNAESILSDLAATEQTLLDKLETKNVDFGYDQESGHKQLLDAVNDAIKGLEEIKKHFNLDKNKLKEYEKTKPKLDVLENVKLDLVSLKSDFESKFPKFSERLLKEASEKIAMVMDMMNNDDDEDEDADD